MKRLLLFVTGFVLIVIFCLLFTGCIGNSPEKTVKDLTQAVNQDDLDSYRACFTPGFLAEYESANLPQKSTFSLEDHAVYFSCLPIYRLAQVTSGEQIDLNAQIKESHVLDDTAYVYAEMSLTKDGVTEIAQTEFRLEYQNHKWRISQIVSI